MLTERQTQKVAPSGTLRFSVSPTITPRRSFVSIEVTSLSAYFRRRNHLSRHRNLRSTSTERPGPAESAGRLRVKGPDLSAKSGVPHLVKCFRRLRSLLHTNVGAATWRDHLRKDNKYVTSCPRRSSLSCTVTSKWEDRAFGRRLRKVSS